MFETYYNRSQKLWVAYYKDFIGQLGDAQYGNTKEQAVFRLGLEVGARPEDYSRPLGEYFAAQAEHFATKE
jgi:hypothetical protein